eukprot:7908868-Pyramimonas_sp.AAC.1
MGATGGPPISNGGRSQTYRETVCSILRTGLGPPQVRQPLRGRAKRAVYSACSPPCGSWSTISPNSGDQQ